MKKVLILISMVALSSTSMAQKGSWYLGGAVGYNSSTNENTASSIKDVTSEWAFSPEFGTFLKDDIQLGVALGVSGGKEKFDGNDVSKFTAVSPTIYGRKFFKITDNFSLFGGLYLSIISEKTTDYGPTVERKSSGYFAKVGAGVAYALSPRFTAVGQYGLFGFKSVKNKVDGTETSTDSDFVFGVNTVGAGLSTSGGNVFNIGLYYTIKQ